MSSYEKKHNKSVYEHNWYYITIKKMSSNAHWMQRIQEVLIIKFSFGYLGANGTFECCLISLYFAKKYSCTSCELVLCYTILFLKSQDLSQFKNLSLQMLHSNIIINNMHFQYVTSNIGSCYSFLFLKTINLILIYHKYCTTNVIFR